MAEIDAQVRALLERWVADPGVAIESLTPAMAREEDLAVLDLQVMPGEPHAVDDVEMPGPAGPLTGRVYRP